MKRKPDELTKECLEQLIKDGKTEKEIGLSFGLSGSAIIYYKKKWNLQSRIIHPDNPHNFKEFITNCIHCNRECKKRTCPFCASVIRHNAVKLALIEAMGGKCSICGYNKCHQSLDFHHLDKESKDFNVTDILKKTKNLSKTVKEAEKYIIICSNCHRELHYQESKSLKYKIQIENYIIKNKLVDKILNEKGKVRF